MLVSRFAYVLGLVTLRQTFVRRCRGGMAESDQIMWPTRVANSFGGERNSRRPKLRHHAIFAVVVLTLSATAAAAEPLPVPKPPGPGGSCPHGYISSGSFCTPSRGAQDAIAKPPNGTCPWGWISSGSFCLRSGRRD